MSQASTSQTSPDTPSEFENNKERRDLERLLEKYQQQFDYQESKINQLEQKIKSLNSKKEKTRRDRRKVDTEIDLVAKSIAGNGIVNIRPSAKEVSEIETIKDRRAKEREERSKRVIRWRGDAEGEIDCSDTNNDN